MNDRIYQTLAVSILVLGWVTGAAMAESDLNGSGDMAQSRATTSPELVTRVIKVSGTAMTRNNDDQPWQKVEENQKLEVGAQIRTGVRGAVVLAVGPNATVNVDRLSELAIGRLEHDAQTNTIRTFLGVKHGKVDFHVKHVGFENDFRIASPSDVMAVRGTIGTFKAYEGPAEITGHPTNRSGAITGKGRNDAKGFALSQNESVQDGQRDPNKTQESNQDVGNKLAGGRSFEVNQLVNNGGQTSLRGREAQMGNEARFSMIASMEPSLTEFCNPESPYYDADRCRRIRELLGLPYQKTKYDCDSASDVLE